MVLVALAACNNTPPDPRVDDNQTYGQVLVMADEAFRPVLEDERYMFEALYERAHVDIRYLPERELTHAMLNDSVRVVFAAFVPGGDQQAYFKTRNLTPHVEAVLTDAIALVVGRNSPMDSLGIDAVKELLAGQGSGTTAVFDDIATGVVRTLVDSLFNGDATMVKNASALPGVDSLLARVARDPQVIGFIPFSLISDLDDPEHRARLEKVKVLAISAGGGRALKPSQSTLADGQYPLRRKLYMMVTEGKSGLGTGFASFVAGHKGQRIVLKQGLSPAHVPTREVMIVNE